MSEEETSRSGSADLLEGIGWLCRDARDAGDDRAATRFAALYVRLGGQPADIPAWVAHDLVTAAGRRHPNLGVGPEGRTLNEAIFLHRFKHLVERARDAIARAGGRGFRPGRDGKMVPIPGNQFEYTLRAGDGHRGRLCAIINLRGEKTKDFQVLLARECGIGATGYKWLDRNSTGNAAKFDADYRHVRRLLDKHALSDK